MDVMAHKLGMDPVRFRQKNLLRRGEELKPKARPLDADLFMGLEQVTQKLGWDGPVTKNGGGRGIAFGVTNPGAALASTATVHVLSDGSVVLLAGTTEVGQGARTVMCQITAEELCVPMERVSMRPTDTAYTPFDQSTASSRSTTVMGKAVQLAAQDAKKQLLEIAAEQFEAPMAAISLQDGEVLAGRQRVAYGELIRRHYTMHGGEIVGRGYVHGGMAPSPADPLFWEIAIGGAEVEVDRDTGEISVKRYITAADAGKALNPRQCKGQDEGATVMGLGHTLYEAIIYEDGRILNSNLMDYHVPTFLDLPEQFQSILIENEDGPGPYGAKGIGEGAIVPVAPAIANAIAWSTGARIRELPLTPERVWRAVRERKKS